jgi:hypothetical protein
VIGCESGVQIDLAEGIRPAVVGHRVQLCIEDNCRMMTPASSIVALALPLDVPAPATRRVTLQVFGPDGSAALDASIDARFEKFQPNGADCKPICSTARLELHDNGELAPAPTGS